MQKASMVHLVEMKALSVQQNPATAISSRTNCKKCSKSDWEDVLKLVSRNIWPGQGCRTGKWLGPPPPQPGPFSAPLSERAPVDHSRFIVDGQTVVAPTHKIPNAVDDQGFIVNYVAVPCSAARSPTFLSASAGASAQTSAMSARGAPQQELLGRGAARASKHTLGRRGRDGNGDGDGDGDGEGSSDNERDSAPSAFAPPPFTPTLTVLAQRKRPASAYPALGPPFRAVHARHSPPPQSPFSATFSPALVSPYPPTAAGAGADTAPADAHVQQALVECAMPRALGAPAVAGAGAAVTPMRMRMCKHRASAMRTHAATRCHSRSCHQRMCTGAPRAPEPQADSNPPPAAARRRRRTHGRRHTSRSSRHPPGGSSMIGNADFYGRVARGWGCRAGARRLLRRLSMPELRRRGGAGRGPGEIASWIGRWDEQAMWDWNGDEDGDDDGRGGVSRCTGLRRPALRHVQRRFEDPAE
ncbi:hypothetical protein B0H14DRAFT_3138793 [Mycena olivaceomarginata]|nr:hypothetical protein B0H14DRAFT_3138793 [Mycena olivaceomarginata]